MSAPLRSAWMPPAVAHAPMVTSRPDWRRMSTMRSASWAVVIEPSTSDTSYGPSTIVDVASGKYEMATRSATASSSSSQSSRLSWQPSHDANFHTARVGRRSSTVPPQRSRTRRASAISG
jgi:hypothetical protein